MLTKKQREFFNLIINCYKETKSFPTLTLLKEKGNYKSYNSIYKYLNVLEEKGYIKKDKYSKKITYILSNIDNETILNIPVVNDNTFYKIAKEYCYKNIDYLAYKIHDNNLKSENVLKNDLLIIEKRLLKANNKLVLILKNNNYYIYKYTKQNEFVYLSNDKESFILNDSIKVIGKVITLIRKLTFQTLD